MTDENNPTRSARRGHTPMPTKGEALRARGGSAPRGPWCRCCAAALLLAVAGWLALPALAHAQTAPTITSVAFTSDGGPDGYDGTYRIDNAIEATVTFSAAVTVTGTPQLALNVGGEPRRADYESGSGSTELVFSYTVVEGDEDTDGVAVEKDEIALNGGTIQAGTTDAALSHGAEAANPAHKVDGIRPTLVSIETSVDGATVLVTFSENLTAGRSLSVVFPVSITSVVTQPCYPRRSRITSSRWG